MQTLRAFNNKQPAVACATALPALDRTVALKNIEKFFKAVTSEPEFTVYSEDTHPDRQDSILEDKARPTEQSQSLQCTTLT